MNYMIEKISDTIIKIDEFGLGSMYFIKGSHLNALIDTGTGVGNLKAFIDQLSDKPYIVICTHGHVDHIGGIHQFKEVYLHDLDHYDALQVTLKQRQDYARNLLARYSEKPFNLNDLNNCNTSAVLLSLKDGDSFDLGDCQLDVIHLPGHTSGSICLLDRKHQVLFSGDNIQHLELLMMPSDNREDVVEMWLNGLYKIQALRPHFNLLLGGHEPLEIEVLDHLIECGQGILAGTIIPTKKTIHIFEGLFANYKNVHITYSANLKGNKND